MVDQAKLFFCSGMLLLFLGAGCAGTQSNSVAIFDSQPNTLPSRKRMIIIAQTYEEQGHKQRAITTYRHLSKRYPKTEQGKFAHDRILAMQGSDKQKKIPGAAEEAMLASSASKPSGSSKTMQAENKKKQLRLETLEETLIPELPLPEQLADTSGNNYATLLVKDNPQDSDNSKLDQSSVGENAKWPEWSGNEFASAGPRVGLEEETVKPPSSYPLISSIQKKKHKEELLLPPVASSAGEQDAGSRMEVPIIAENVVDLSWKARQTKTEKKETIWVASKGGDESASEGNAGITPEVTFESDAENQEQINDRLTPLASLAYQVGNEELVADEALDSLEVLLDHEDQHVRINSAEALFRHHRGSEKALLAITSAFSSTDESIRFVAVHALVSAYDHAPEETLQIMMDQLETESAPVQRQIALLLGGFRGHSSALIPRLQQLADDHPAEEVREAAMLSLVCLKE